MTNHSDQSDKMFTVTVKRVLVQHATAYVRAKDRAEANNDAIKQAETNHLDFDDTEVLGIEVEEITEG